MPVPTLISQLSTTASLNSPDGAVDVPSSIDDYQRAHAAFIAQLYAGTVAAPTVIVPSATTTDIGAAASENVDISGTATITGFGIVAEGINRKGRFTGVLTLTHNATSLILPGNANITTANNDRYEARSLGGGNWIVTKYVYANGNVISATKATTATTATTATHLAGGSGGTIPYQTASGATAMLANGTAGQVLKSNGTTLAPSWVNPPATVFASSAENAAGAIENKAVDPLGIREAFNATGTAPVYACRAWVNFNGTGTVAIRASGNVSSITDNGVGDYTVNFTTALPDNSYAVLGSCRGQSDADATSTLVGAGVLSTTAARVYSKNGVNQLVDSSAINVAIFR
jgi:hypothetical protein